MIVRNTVSTKLPWKGDCPAPAFISINELVHARHWSVKATTASPGFVESFPCPPAQITTYCRPSYEYDIGVDWALAGSSALQTSLPVRESKARNRVSIADASKTNPPAVAVGPPRFTEPAGAPGAIDPNGTSHRFSPVFKSTAVSVPHGGGLHGKWCAKAAIHDTSHRECPSVVRTHPENGSARLRPP